jgi:hypothetical protein
MLKIRRIILILLTVFSAARADVVTLKNGQAVEGAVIKFGNEYRIKQADGTTKVVKETDVASITKVAAGAQAVSAAEEPGSVGIRRIGRRTPRSSGSMLAPRACL